MNKILIIEDEETISSMYEASMTKAGFEVILASDGEAGIKMAVKNHPDLILLDVMIPKIDGFAVLERLKSDSVTKKIPVVMLTNLGQSEDKEKGKKLGAVDYWVKADFTPAQVNKKITKLFS